MPPTEILGFPGGSDGKESTCNAGDLGLIPGLGRFPRGLPSILEKGMATHSKKWLFLPGEFHGQRSLAGYSPWGHKELDITETPNIVFMKHTCDVLNLWEMHWGVTRF